VPNGVSIVKLDRTTNLLADASCTNDYNIAFLDGTAPTQTCDQAEGDQRNVFQRIFGIGQKANAVGPAGAPVNGMQPTPGQPGVPPGTPVPGQTAAAPPPPAEQPKKKKGFLSKLFGKGDKQPQQQDPSQPH
jgi:penicillin-binding protein 1B